jgi:hypothetical protein
MTPTHGEEETLRPVLRCVLGFAVAAALCGAEATAQTAK